MKKNVNDSRKMSLKISILFFEYFPYQKNLLIAYLDDLCIDHRLFVLIIYLVVMTPYNREYFLWTATEGRIDCLFHIFLEINVKLRKITMLRVF